MDWNEVIDLLEKEKDDLLASYVSFSAQKEDGETVSIHIYNGEDDGE